MNEFDRAVESVREQKSGAREAKRRQTEDASRFHDDLQNRKKIFAEGLFSEIKCEFEARGYMVSMSEVKRHVYFDDGYCITICRDPIPVKGGLDASIGISVVTTNKFGSEIDSQNEEVLIWTGRDFIFNEIIGDCVIHKESNIFNHKIFIKRFDLMKILARFFEYMEFGKSNRATGASRYREAQRRRSKPSSDSTISVWLIFTSLVVALLVWVVFV